MKRKSDALSALADRVRFFEEIGAGFLFRSEEPRPEAGAAGETIVAGSPRPAARPAESGLDLPRVDRTLDDVSAEIRACRKCSLAAGRTKAVPGEGNPKSPLMFVGEGPGHDEDVQGRPFVGRAGQLLTKIIAAMGYERSEVFIANVVKCRPPENRVPHREEAEACAPFLIEQISILRPRVIVALGKTAVDFFVPNVKAMGAVRGVFQEWHGLPVMPTFHPSYLVRNEGNREIKRMVWNDMQKVMAFLGGK
ncbi:MAG TPA: uracil-DNA glycosylase [Candidatus Aminicenantes bacterium]|nr:uracil-DNA glycosylase [Acidobacteriota bacterium]OQB58619.1 MAG: Uracil DNA glycosylase superfamily protein [Candidatus Aminicenantes bacterium ADurb.Bin147]HNQ81229.1 uracil-DNA glycosylase [Candidatus Aminicenantes bacterium]MDD8029068.1 uracil-DNA glycosylase [Acidobacteriota bacterium]MDW3227240.1 uracil-DNA glycosylase [Acidobacteriota bacterium]